jgi:hypothetical protein
MAALKWENGMINFGWLKSKIPEGKEWLHIGRNYRQAGIFVKGFKRMQL